MTIKRLKFTTGLKLPENKVTEHMPVTRLDMPSKVILPLQQHFGQQCNLLVKRGEKVKTGQMIADSESFVSAPIHSTITGVVSSVFKMINPLANSIVDAAEITASETEEIEYLSVNPVFEEIKKDLEGFEENKEAGEYLEGKIKEIISKINGIGNEEIISVVKNAGIVGLGGATFPTHVKLSPPKDKKIDSLIINGCECEPYITADHRIMLEYGMQMLIGAYIFYKVLNPRKVYIAIEDNKEDAILNIDNLIMKSGLADNFCVVSLKSKYPMGAEKTLIKNVLKRKVPVGGLPLDVGVVVNNVGTCKAACDAVLKGQPLIEKVISVTGAVSNPGNFIVRIGTPVSEILKCCGEFKSEIREIILGGPMMGNDINEENFPVTKAVNCILIKRSLPRNEGNCIRCGRCVDVCPMNLMPLNYAGFVKNSKFDMCSEYHISSCIECGSCAYVCPSAIPIVAYIKTGKSILAGR
ncbi:MAG TPA: electron transport complex subunit RsxC [Actinobacteria bacterium]|nr:electron transport complex subunit RsxC [Actinomycetota bacterium]